MLFQQLFLYRQCVWGRMLDVLQVGVFHTGVVCDLIKLITLIGKRNNQLSHHPLPHAITFIALCSASVQVLLGFK